MRPLGPKTIGSLCAEIHPKSKNLGAHRSNMAENCPEKASIVQIPPRSSQPIHSFLKRNPPDPLQTKFVHKLQIPVQQIYPSLLKSQGIKNESLTISSMCLTPSTPHTPGMWEEMVGDSLWISEDFQKILVDFLHADSKTQCRKT